MKIREGFVSNSSSSSFVVRFRNAISEEHESLMANEEDIKKLVNYGFVLSGTANPFDINKKGFVDTNKKYAIALKYEVTCNEDFVTAFLIRNNIPFQASIHYENEFYQFRRGDNKILSAMNFGQISAMYGTEHIEEDYKMTDAIKFIPISYYAGESEDHYGDMDQNGEPTTTDEVIKIMNSKYGE